MYLNNTKRLYLLVAGVFVSLVCAELAGSAPITIWPTGEVTPPDAPLHRDGNVYTFVDDITHPEYLGIIVEANGIIIDGDGRKLQGPGTGNGFELSDINGVTIKYTTIEDFNSAISFVGSSDNIIRGNSIRYNGTALAFSDSHYNRFYHNNFIGNGEDVFDVHEINEIIPVSNNFWDANYPSGGNYWQENQFHCDVNHGLLQNESGYDGICDQQYSVNDPADNNNVDRFPSTQPYTLSVHNTDKGLSYYSIQEAIDEASPGDTIRLDGKEYPDLNNDSNVDYKDLAFFTDRWLEKCDNSNWCCNGADLNCTGSVDLEDFGMLARNWLTQCPPKRWYYETVQIDKPISLIGQCPCWTVIDGTRQQEDVLNITASDTRIEGIMIKSAGQGKYGLNLDQCQRIEIIGNTITNNPDHGLRLNQSGNCTVLENQIISNNGVGIDVNGCSSVLLTANHVSNSGGFGIDINDSNDTRIADNTLEINYGGIRIQGSSKGNAICDNSVTSNIADSNGIVLQATGDANTTISSNIVTGSYHGIVLSGTYNNTIADNNVINNSQDGLWLNNAGKNTAENNLIKSNGDVGIRLFNSANVSITRNSVTDCNTGILLESSVDCNIISNIVSDNNVVGIALLSHSDDSNIIRNKITNNGMEDTCGIAVLGTNNKIYNNIFINPRNARSDPNNSWDNGYPDGGNFWSDHDDWNDIYSGPNQNDPNADGICDGPYWAGTFEDRYPLLLIAYKTWNFPIRPKMNQQYKLKVYLKNNDFISESDVNFTGVEQFDVYPPEEDFSYWSLNNTDFKQDCDNLTYAIGPNESLSYEASFYNKWNWLKPGDDGWEFAVVDLFSLFYGLHGKEFLGWDIAKFILNCHYASKAAPEMTYTFKPCQTSDPLIRFYAKVKVYVPGEKYEYLYGSLIVQASAIAVSIAAPATGPGAIAAWAVAAALSAVSSNLYDKAVDPDPNYAQIAQLEPIPTPNDVNSLPPGIEKQLAFAALDLIAIEKAYMNSYIRYDAARDCCNDSNNCLDPNDYNNCDYYLALQLAASVKYNSMATEKLRKIRSYQALLWADYNSPTTQDVQDFVDSVEASGLPPLYQYVLEQAGLTPNDVNTVTRTALDANKMPELYTDLDTTLNYLHAAVQAHYREMTALNNTAMQEDLPVQFSYDVALKDLWLTPPQGFVLDQAVINVIIENPGIQNATCDIDVSVDDTIIDTKTTALSPGTRRILQFNWDQTGMSTGYYTIKAQATVQQAPDTFNADNTITKTLTILP